MQPSSPTVVFFNPWARLIGPNRYLIEMLRQLPALAGRATVAFEAAHDGREEYHRLGCRTAVWPEIELLRARLDLRQLPAMVRNHSLGLARLRRRLKALRPALLVSNTENLWLGGLAGRLLGIPHVQIFHSMTVFERLGRRRWLLSAYLRFLAFLSRRFIAVSRAQVTRLADAGVPAARVVVVPNPIDVGDVERRASQPAPHFEAAIEERRPCLVCAGNIAPMKGQDLLVEALAEVRREFPEVLCLFAGRLMTTADISSADFSRQLEARIAALDLADNVRFLGQVPDLPALLQRADLYVQPSRTESFGRVLAEAQVCGTPVVAFDVGGIPEVAGPDALLVAAGDAAGLAAAIRRRLRDPRAGLESARSGRAHVAAEFDAAKVAPRFQQTLRELAPGLLPAAG